MSKTQDPRDPPQPDDSMNFTPTESEQTDACGSLSSVAEATDGWLAERAWRVACADCGALTQASGNFCIHCGAELES